MAKIVRKGRRVGFSIWLITSLRALADAIIGRETAKVERDLKNCAENYDMAEELRQKREENALVIAQYLVDRADTCCKNKQRDVERKRRSCRRKHDELKKLAGGNDGSHTNTAVVADSATAGYVAASAGVI